MRVRGETILPTALLLVATLVSGAAVLAYVASLANTPRVSKPCILSLVELPDGGWVVYNPCARSVNATLLSGLGTCTVIDQKGVLNATKVVIPPGSAIVVYGRCKAVIADGRVYRLK